MRSIRLGILATTVAFATLGAAPAAHACMGCDGVCAVLTSRPVQVVTHSDHCPVQ